MSETNQKMGNDFTTGSLLPLFIKFVFPFLVANILNSIYNTVDMIIIGQNVGTAGTAAISIGGRVLNAFSFVGLGLASGGQVYVSQLIGSGKRSSINTAVGTTISLLTVFAVFFALITVVFSNTIMVWLNVGEDFYIGAKSYMIITAIGFPLLYGYNGVSCILRGMGDSKHPLLFIAIASVSNLILDIIFVSFLHLAEAGAALATVLGQGISLALSARLLYKKREHFGFDFKPESFKINIGIAKVILQIGLPIAFRNGLIMFVQVGMNGRVNSYGTNDAAAFGIGLKLSTFATIVSSSCTQAGGTIVAQNIAAGKPERVNQQVRQSILIIIAFAVLASIPCLLFSTAIFRLFSNEPDVLAYAPRMMKYIAVVLFLVAFQCGTGIITTGSGASGVAFCAGITDGLIFRIAISFVLAYKFNMGMMGFFIGDCFARFGYITVNGIYYLSGKWKNKILIK